MKTRTSLLLTGICLFAVGCVEPGETLSDDDSSPVSSEQRRAAPELGQASPTRGGGVARPPSGLQEVCFMNPEAFPARAGKGAFGDIDFDGKCSLLIAGAQDNALYRFDPRSRHLRVVASDFPESDSAVAVAYMRSEDVSYVATSLDAERGRLYRVDSGGEIVTALSLEGAQVIRALAVAPPKWGPYGGKLVMAQDGSVVVFDPDVGASRELVRVSTLLTDLSFSAKGTLFVGDYDGAVHIVAPDGEVKTIAEGLRGVDGVAAGRDDEYVYVSEAQAGFVSVIDVRSGERKSTIDVALGPGPGVTGMIVDDSSTLLVTSVRDDLRLIEAFKQ